MLSFLSWYLTLSLMGWLTFPLAYRMLPALPDRGYAFSRILGLLLWGYGFWLLGSLGVLYNERCQSGCARHREANGTGLY
jgi:hypothetical protein